jgi:hypothetical protein
MPIKPDLGAICRSLRWSEPWLSIIDMDQLKQSLQRELELEITAQHPLWGSAPEVFARSGASDDILCATQDGRFALVHLVWSGKADPRPQNFPSAVFIDSLESVQSLIDSEAFD